MPIRNLTYVKLGSITTSSILSITSAATLFTLNSGNQAIEVTNLGSTTIYYSFTNAIAQSGGIILSQSSKFWDSVVDNFSMYFFIASGGITNNIIVQQYAGD